MTVKLGVNIDHIATLRQARGEKTPDPVEAAKACLMLGAHYIVLHIRGDRRHVQDSDLERLVKDHREHIHLEMANTKEMMELALKYKPYSVCLVPEYPNEITTSGGLKMDDDTVAALKASTLKLKQAGIEVSLFIDPAANDVRKAKNIGADIIEFCTKNYGEAKDERNRQKLLEEIELAAVLACELGLRLHAGHGLNTDNVGDIAAIDCMECLNIGFSIVARSVFVGLPQAVLEIKTAIEAAR